MLGTGYVFQHAAREKRLNANLGTVAAPSTQRRRRCPRPTRHEDGFRRAVQEEKLNTTFGNGFGT